jgi:hypothetical protein
MSLRKSHRWSRCLLGKEKGPFFRRKIKSLLSLFTLKYIFLFFFFAGKGSILSREFCLWDTAKAVLRGKFIAMSAYIKKTKDIKSMI